MTYLWDAISTRVHCYVLTAVRKYMIVRIDAADMEILGSPKLQSTNVLRSA